MTKAKRAEEPLVVESEEPLGDPDPTAVLQVEPDTAPEPELDVETQVSEAIADASAKAETLSAMREELRQMAAAITGALATATEALALPFAEITEKLAAIEKDQAIILAQYDISDENKAWLVSASAQLQVRIGEIVDQFVTERRSWSPSTRLAKLEGPLSDRAQDRANGRGCTFSDVVRKAMELAEELGRL